MNRQIFGLTIMGLASLIYLSTPAVAETTQVESVDAGSGSTSWDITYTGESVYSISINTTKIADIKDATSASTMTVTVTNTTTHLCMENVILEIGNVTGDIPSAPPSFVKKKKPADANEPWEKITAWPAVKRELGTLKPGGVAQTTLYVKSYPHEGWMPSDPTYAYKISPRLNMTIGMYVGGGYEYIKSCIPGKECNNKKDWKGTATTDSNKAAQCGEKKK